MFSYGCHRTNYRFRLHQSGTEHQPLVAFRFFLVPDRRLSYLFPNDGLELGSCLSRPRFWRLYNIAARSRDYWDYFVHIRTPNLANCDDFKTRACRICNWSNSDIGFSVVSTIMVWAAQPNFARRMDCMPLVITIWPCVLVGLNLPLGGHGTTSARNNTTATQRARR